MLTIGCHLSSADGFLSMGKEAISINANTFQFFTRNPRGFKSKNLDVSDCESFNKYWKEHDGKMIVAHAPYTLNPCSADERVRELAHMIMSDDLQRLEHINGVYYNFHPGSHVKQGVEVGTTYIVNLLNEILTPTQSTIVLLETMAGKGSEIGKTFEELKAIIDRVDHSEKLGVCLDTCHLNDAGYDMSNFDEYLDRFDQEIGIDRIGCIHINDSKNPISSHKDRHENIGFGTIGFDNLINIIYNKRIEKVPKILETPYVDKKYPPYKYEIKMIRDKTFDSKLIEKIVDDK